MSRPDAVSFAAVTLRDVCREAGVSLATADRVLNGRPGVRAATAERVRAASERLGYQANPFATRLARGDSFRLAFVLPRGRNAFMLELGEQVTRMAAHLARQRVAVELIHVDAFDPALLATRLEALDDGFSGVAVVAVDDPLVGKAIDRLAARGIAVVTLVSDVPGSRRLHYVGVDNIAAGRTAGTLLGRFTGARRGPVGVIIGSERLSDHAERLRGFSAVIAEEHARLSVLPPRTGRDDDAASKRAATALLREHANLVGLYAVGAGTVGIAQALHQAGREKDIVLIGHELTATSCAQLRAGAIDALINQDAGHEARSAARVLTAHLTGEPIVAEQERIRIEIFLRDNLP
jgi:LacI family transcriptional regulator